jgi:hypothetical protein
VTLRDFADYAQIFGVLTVVVGGCFALVQLSELRKQRRDAIAAELMRTFYSVDLGDAVALIRTLPDHCAPTDLRAMGPAYERAAVLVNTSFETMGLLAFERVADFQMVLRLAGGIVVVMWRKLDRWVEYVRTEQSQPSWAEWFQWLAERAAAYKDQSPPAHVAHKDWAP